MLFRRLSTGHGLVLLILALATGPLRADELDVLLDGPAGATEEPSAAAAAAEPVAAVPVGEQEVASTPRPAAIEEIVVTAQRREESLQDVPISVKALGAEEIEQRDITSFADVAPNTPGFVFSQHFGQVTPTIRGLGADRYSISNEPGVALYVDDIYYGRPYLPQAALTHIERIEILRGPQGTLYGRNSTGGALKIVSKRPSDELETSGGLQYGSFDQVVAQGSLSGPVLEGLAARLSFFAEDRDGYVENRTLDEIVEAHQVLSGRLAVGVEPLDWLRLDASLDTTRQEDTGPVGHATTPVSFGVVGDSLAVPAFAPYDAILFSLEEQFSVALDPLREQILTELAGGRTSDDPRVVFQDQPSTTDIDTKGVAGTLTATFADVEAKLISGYRDSRRDLTLDVDMTDVPGGSFTPPTFTTGRQTSAELQIASVYPLGRLGELRWLTGGFFYDEDGREVFTVSLLQLTPEQLDGSLDQIPPEVAILFEDGALSQIQFLDTQDVRSYAGFADLEWEALRWLRFHLGGRYTSDHKEAVGTIRNLDPGNDCENQRGSATFDAFTLRSGIDLPWDDERLLYASFSQGFKSGGFNPLVCDSPAYDPEYVDAVEIGVKSRWLDGQLQLNASGFFYDFTDIQVEKIVGFATEVVNAASASIHGAELEMTALLLENVSLDGGVGWLDARYDDFFDDDPFTQSDPSEVDLSGNRLTKSPEWSGNLGLQLFHGLGDIGEAVARAEWSYTGPMFYDHFNHDFAEGDAYQLWNLYLNLQRPGGTFGVQGFVKNLADEIYYVGQVAPSPTVIGGPLTYFSLPRTWGFELYARF